LTKYEAVGEDYVAIRLASFSAHLRYCSAKSHRLLICQNFWFLCDFCLALFLLFVIMI